MILVMISDWKVPPIEEQSARHAVALKHVTNDWSGMSGSEIRAPMLDKGCVCAEGWERKGANGAPKGYTSGVCRRMGNIYGLYAGQQRPFTSFVQDQIIGLLSSAGHFITVTLLFTNNGMSFRKRADVVAGSPRAVPGRTPSAVPGRSGPGLGAARPLVPERASHRPKAGAKSESGPPNPAIRPSSTSSQPTVSTGTADLDKILHHLGLPLGNSLIIEETGTTDFASVLLRAFVSQSVVHNRLEKDVWNSHSIVVGLGSDWAKDLPGIYKGTSKEQKRAQIHAHESKISVSNLSGGAARAEKDMKIAWRYGLQKTPEAAETFASDVYSHQFDLTQKLVPGPGPQDVSFVPLSLDPRQVLAQIAAIVASQTRTNASKVVRIVVPNFLNPSVYGPLHSQPNYVIPFVHGLRAILRQNPANLVVVASLPLDLYPRDSLITATVEGLADAVVHLQPFNQEMSMLIERAYKNEPQKVQQGLVHVVKVPVLSERGLMMVHDGEYAFKNGRKRFEIEPWGIPVEEDGGEDRPISKDIEF